MEFNRFVGNVEFGHVPGVCGSSSALLVCTRFDNTRKRFKNEGLVTRTDAIFEFF
jgi:hypothetical protein